MHSTGLKYVGNTEYYVTRNFVTHSGNVTLSYNDGRSSGQDNGEKKRVQNFGGETPWESTTQNGHMEDTEG